MKYNETEGGLLPVELLKWQLIESEGYFQSLCLTFDKTPRGWPIKFKYKALLPDFECFKSSIWFWIPFSHPLHLIGLQNKLKQVEWFIHFTYPTYVLSFKYYLRRFIWPYCKLFIIYK